MALLHFDGFDNYSGGQMTSLGVWNSVVITSAFGGPTASISTGAGGRTNNALIAAGTGNVAISGIARKTVTPGDATAILGFSLKPSGFPVDMAIAAIEDSATEQVTLVLKTDGTFYVTRGNRLGSVIGTTSYAISVGSTHYIEWLATINNTTGVLTLKVDGDTKLSLTGQNTRGGTGNNSWNGFWLGAQNVSNFTTVDTWKFDDLVVLDTTGSAPYNTFLGDVTVDTIEPTADGNYTAFTPSTGVNHYATVDETPADTSDYNTGLVTNDRDSLIYVLPSGKNYYAVSLFPVMSQSSAGSRTAKEFVRVSGTDYDNSTTDTLSTTDTFFHHIRTVDPSTSGAWASGSKEFGIKVQA